jgi:hypothetical protein
MKVTGMATADVSSIIISGTATGTATGTAGVITTATTATATTTTGSPNNLNATAGRAHHALPVSFFARFVF